MLSAYVLAWLRAFIFTQLIEVPIYRRQLGVSPLSAFGASAISHPIVWFAIFPHLHASYLFKACLAELFAVALESAYFGWGFGKKRAWLACLAANAASLALGLASRWLFGVP